MDLLWSPWRSQYIESFKTKKENNSCIFCEAVKEKISDDSCLKVYEDNLCFVMMNLYPYNSGHLLIIPKRHISDINALSVEELAEMMSNVRKSISVLSETMKAQGYNFGANLGKAAGAGIDDHLHFHVVPRWNGDTNFFPVIGEVKVISQDLLAAKNQLINGFKKLDLSKEK